MQQEIDLTKLLRVLKNKRWHILQASGVLTIVALIYCIFATPIFTAKTIINPPKLTDAGSGVSQALSGLAAFGFTGGGGFLSQKTDSDVAIAMLKTAQLKNMVIRKFNLVKYYKQKNIELTRKSLDRAVKFVPDVKSGFLQIEVDDKSPKIAADIANYYSIALGQLISNVAYNKSNAKEQFYAEQIEVIKKNLHEAQNRLKDFAMKNGIASGQQVQMVTSLTMQLQAQLVVSQAQLQAMSLYATNDNPEYKNLQAKINGLRKQLDVINGQQNMPNNQLPVPANLAPELAEQYTNLMSDVMINEEVLKILYKEYEAAKIDSMSELVPTAIQVIDPALVPMYKSRPSMLRVVGGGFVLGFFISSMYFIIRKRKEFIVAVNTPSGV